MAEGPRRPWASRLGPRLEGVLGLLTPCEHLVDVGTDHGLVPLAAVQRGIARRATGVDRRAAPLAEAARTLAAADSNRVTLRLGEGLDGVGEVDAVVVAGMGTASIIEVLRPLEARLGRQCVLAPLTEAARLRRWARLAGWWLEDEVWVLEGHRRFLLLRLTGGVGPDPAYDVPGWEVEALEHLGPRLLAGRTPGFLGWLEAEEGRLGPLATAPGSQAVRQLAWVVRARSELAPLSS